MEAAGIFKDVIDKFTVTVPLKITYGSKEVKDGNELKPSEVTNAPKITWNADAKDLYTLAMVDPDAPSRKDPKFGEWRHWLVINIPGNELSKGTVISQYAGASPPKGTGLHRYIFLLFKQPGELKLSPMDDKGKGRANFKIREFAKTHKLTPVGGNFFQAQSE
jgi:phosphatidylethanolamine-binding protein (PEBP) family uncharacterized protein